MSKRSRDPKTKTRIALALASIVSVLALCSDRQQRLAHAAPRPGERPLRIAAKPFTESYLLAELLAQLVEAVGEAPVERKFGIGGPQFVIDGLQAGELDIDVNYTGALAHLYLPSERAPSEDRLRSTLRERGLLMSSSLGFNNTYAIAVRSETAQRLRLSRISDLVPHRALRGAFTPDFLNYEDGFYRLQQVYGVTLASVRPMQHSLAYQALASGEIDLTDAYTTDGSLPLYSLTLLRDDRDFFPRYEGVIVIRAEAAARVPQTWARFRQLEGRFRDDEMLRLNAEIDVKHRAVAEVAREVLAKAQLVAPQPAAATAARTLDHALWVATIEHLVLVLSALVLSALVGIPIGIAAVRYRRLGQVLIALTSLLQTIPSLALLCFLIPFLGIGALPTVAALFLYGLLPIAQSTAAGLLSIDARLIETAKLLGLGRTQRLRWVELPMASPAVWAGLKTTAVINVATATLAALIGAGGYGRFITSGLALNDPRLLLKGAVPTAVMAVALHAIFEWLSQRLMPKGLAHSVGEKG
jgi:osmoprotectant transport system permease protein